MFCTFCSVASASKQACECSSLIVPAARTHARDTGGIHPTAACLTRRHTRTKNARKHTNTPACLLDSKNPAVETGERTHASTHATFTQRPHTLGVLTCGTITHTHTHECESGADGQAAHKTHTHCDTQSAHTRDCRCTHAQNGWGRAGNDLHSHARSHWGTRTHAQVTRHTSARPPASATTTTTTLGCC